MRANSACSSAEDSPLSDDTAATAGAPNSFPPSVPIKNKRGTPFPQSRTNVVVGGGCADGVLGRGRGQRPLLDLDKDRLHRAIIVCKKKYCVSGRSGRGQGTCENGQGQTLRACISALPAIAPVPLELGDGSAASSSACRMRRVFENERGHPRGSGPAPLCARRLCVRVACAQYLTLVPLSAAMLVRLVLSWSAVWRSASDACRSTFLSKQAKNKTGKRRTLEGGTEAG